MKRKNKKVTAKFLARKFFRFLFLVLLAAAIFLAGSVFVVTRIFNAEKISMIAGAQLSEILEKPVVVEDAVILPFRGFKIKGFRVMDGAPAGAEMLSSGPIEVVYDFWELISAGKFVPKSVKITGARINIVRNPDGTTNFSYLLKPAAEGGGASSNKSGFSFVSGKVILKDIAVSIKNQNGADRDDFILQSAELWNVHPSQDFLFRLEFDGQNNIAGKKVGYGVTAEGYANLSGFVFEKSYARDIEAQINIARRPIFVSADIRNFASPIFKTRIKIPELSYSDFSIFSAKPLPFALPPSVWNIYGFLSGKTISGNYDADIGNIPLKGAVSADLSAASRFSVSFQTGEISADTAVKMWGNILNYAPSGRIKSSGKIEISQGKTAISSLNVSAQGVKCVLGDFVVSDLTATVKMENYFGTVNVSAQHGSVSVGGQAFADMAVSAEYKDGVLAAEISKGTLNNSPFKAKLNVKNLPSADRKINFLMSTDEFKLPQFFDTVSDIAVAVSRNKTPRPNRWEKDPLGWLKNFKEKIPEFMPNFTGALYAKKFTTPIISGADLYVEYNLRGLLPSMRALDGTISARMGPGIVYQLERMAEKQKALDVAFKPFLAMHKMEKGGAFKVGSVLRDVRYDSMGIYAVFSNGVSDIRNFYLTGQAMNANIRGAVNWPDEKLNIFVNTVFKKVSSLGGLSENLTDDEGHPALSFDVKGSMVEPETAMKVPAKAGEEIKKSSAEGVPGSFSEIKIFAAGG